MPSQKNEMEDKQAELKKYPSTFDVFENLPVSTEDIRKIKVKLLIDEKSEEYDTEMEMHRIWNLISFLCFVLQDHTGAEKYVEKVLKSDSGNMIALSNKTWFFLKQCSINQQFEENCKKLERLKKNNFACLVAKAEIAFTYSRLGVKRYDKAKSLYKNVIDECDEIMAKDETKDTKRLKSYLCVWMFGYALVEKRLLNFSNTFDETKIDLSADNYKRVIELYCRIIQQEKCSNCIRRYQARSLVDIGLLTYNMQTTAQSDTSSIYPDNVDLPEQTEDFFTTAFKIFPDDVYVLEKSGQYYRYARNIERSIQLLEKAIKIKGTSHAYHHLALSKKRKLDIDIGNCKSRIFKSSFTQNKPRTMTFVKSPLKQKPIDYRKNKIVADEIIRCFEKSIEISFNTAAIYDKGLFYRQLGMLDKALESFEYLIRNEEGHSSRLDMANAFEQAGLCLSQMLEQECRKEQRKGLETKKKMYIKSSIEISCRVAANIPALKSCWKSYSTLKSLIGEASTKENKKDLLFLYEKMERHHEALEVLNELEGFPQTKDERVTILKEKVKTYTTLGLYDDAVLTFSRMPNALDTIGEDMYLQMYVEAGIDALKKGNDWTARNRIHSALEIGNRNKTNEDNSTSNDASTEERYDIFILCNADDEENGKKLMDIMIRMGLQTTLNTDRLLPGTSMLSGMTDEMKKANHFMIIFDFDADDKSVANRMRHLTERLQSIVEAREPGSSTIIVIKAITCDMVPDMFLGYKTIDMELHTVPVDFTKNETACKSVKELLIAIYSTS
ncbi:uncharacterized protein LOC128547363 [Mercenaria mercenaria]|uniref:uncharacterized protein LOC128547363 n=1 Tax=Mercenaria mercenaria TaxID=6596 RepID=UPI00234F35F3|nr:uncharacterized protein LOC128547363 [Mercenaria mercenaria]